MTNFSDLQLRSEVTRQLSDTVRSGFIPNNAMPSAESQDTTVDDPWWKDTLHGLGKFEEIKTKFIGGLLSNDEKYRDPMASSTFDTQQSYVSLLRDAGLNQENFGVTGSVVSAILGIGAAIADPTDPFNKIKLGAKTVKGAVGGALDMFGLKSLVGVKGAQTISKSSIAEAIALNLKRAQNTGLPKSARKQAKRNVKAARSVEKNISGINKSLLKLQKAGNSIEDLHLAPTRFEQAQKGQRTALGFSSPTSLDQLSLFGLGRGAVDQAAVVGVPKAVSAALMRSTDAVGKGLGGVLDLTRQVMQKVGFPEKESKITRQAAQEVKQAVAVAKGDVAQMQLALEGIFRKYNFTEAEWHEIMNALQEREVVEHLAIARQALDKMVTDSPDVFSFKSAKKVRRVPEGAKFAQGSKLTHDQRLNLTPSGLDAADVARATAQSAASQHPPVPVGQHSAHILGEYVVLQGGSAKARVGDLKDLDDVFGVQLWHRVDGVDGGPPSLVARRMPFVGRITDENPLQAKHFEQLEQIAAQLARKKKSLVDVTPEDLLISEFGGVQIINPDSIGPAKNVDEAADASNLALQHLLQISAQPLGPGREFHFLKNAETVRQVPQGVEGLSFRVAGVADHMADVPGVQFMNSHDLLREAGNANPERQFVRGASDGLTPEQVALITKDGRDFARAQGIDAHRQAIQRQRAAGQTPAIKPISVAKDDEGILQIVDVGGKARLAAAIIEGLDVIPIVRLDHIGEVADNGFAAFATHKLGAVFQMSGPRAKSMLGEKNTVSANYRMLDNTGNSVVVGDADLVTPHGDSVIQDVLDFASVGTVHTRKQKGSRASRFLDKLMQVFGNERNAAHAIADIAEASKDFKDFSNNLEKVIKPSGEFNLSSTRDANFVADAHRSFSRLKQRSSKHLDELANKGVFSNIGLKNDARVAMASSARGVTIQGFDLKTNTLTFTNKRVSAASLAASVEDFIKGSVAPSSVEPYGNIRRVGELDELTDKVHVFNTEVRPRMADSMQKQPVFKITEAQKEALKRKYGTLVDPDELPGLTEGILLGRTEDTAGNVAFKRPVNAYFMTRSGSIVVGTGPEGSDVQALWSQVYGEGKIYAQEFGVISNEGVHISNPLGAHMPVIGTGEVRAMGNRLVEVAKKLRGLGLADSTTVTVHVPFSQGVWSQMFKRGMTLGEMLDDKFRLKIPKSIKGHVPDLTLDAPRRYLDEGGAVELKKVQLSSPATQKIFDFIADQFDEVFVAEAHANLSPQYHQSYVARVITKEAQDALNETHLKMLADPAMARTLDKLDSFFKTRVFTNFTIHEINDIIGTFAGTKELPKDLLDVLYDYAKKSTGKEANKAELHAFAKLASSVPSGVRFFETNPIMALSQRFAKSRRAITRKEVFESLAEHSSIWKGTPSEHSALVAGRSSTVTRIETDINKLTDELTKNQQSLAQVDVSAPSVDSMAKEGFKKRISTLTDQINRKQLDLAEAEAIFTREHGIVAGEIGLATPNRAWVSSEDLNRMVKSGLIDETDIIGSIDDAMAQIPFVKYRSKLDAGGVQIALFPPEIAAVAERYFGATRAGNKILAGYDNVRNLWRDWTLFPVPAYHFRNMFSNYFMSWLGGSTDFENYKSAFSMLNVMRKKGKGHLSLAESNEALQAMEFFSDTGQQISGRAMLAGAFKGGVFQGGLHVNEFGRYRNLKSADDLTRLAVDNGALPASALPANLLVDNKLLRGGKKLGASIENHFRLQAFIDSWRKTGSFDEAALHTKKLFYDYSDLNAFERDVMRRIFPFYSWSRHNIPRMLETMATDPVKHYRISRGFRAIEQGATEGRPEGDADLPEWMQKNFGLPIWRQEDGSYAIKFAEGLLPMHEVYGMIAGHGIYDSLISGVTPFGKVPLEQFFNHATFNEQKIEFFPGQKAKSFTLGQAGFTRRVTVEGPLGIMNLVANESLFRGFFRAGGEITSKVLDPIFSPEVQGRDKATIGAHVLGFVLGKVHVYSPETLRAMMAKDGTKKLRQLNNYVQNALRSGDTEAADMFARERAWLLMMK